MISQLLWLTSRGVARLGVVRSPALEFDLALAGLRRLTFLENFSLMRHTKLGGYNAIRTSFTGEFLPKLLGEMKLKSMLSKCLIEILVGQDS